MQSKAEKAAKRRARAKRRRQQHQVAMLVVNRLLHPDVKKRELSALLGKFGDLRSNRARAEVDLVAPRDVIDAIVDASAS